MNFLTHRLRWLAAMPTSAAAVAASLAFSGAALAEPVTVKVTANWAYAAYTGTASGSALTLLGTDTNFTNAETYTTNLPVGSYLYVVAWTDPFDEFNGFQASLSNDTTTVRTDTTHWEAVRHNLNETDTLPPGTTALANQIAAASWQTNIVSAPGTDMIGDPQASWIWLGSMSVSGPAAYFVFRTSLGGEAIDPPGSVPEPHTAVLALLALGAAGTARRKLVSVS
jgi:MYXO-CTERM domain-containing protein